MSWAAAATASAAELREAVREIRRLHLPPSNTALVSPRGSAALPSQSKRAAHLIVSRAGFATASLVRGAEQVAVADTVITAEDVASLRRYSHVVLDESSCAGPYQLATMVVSLCLAGVPVATAGLPQVVRRMIDPALLTITDAVEERRVRSSSRREAISIAVRRCAQRLYGYRDPSDPDPAVAVLIRTDNADDAERQLDEMRQQTWPNTRIRMVSGASGEVDAPTDAVLVTELHPAVTYGPHHIEDLVLAMHYSGAARVASPWRFSVDPASGIIREHRSVCEDFGQPALPGTVLWQQGRAASRDRDSLYLVHGCGAVALRDPWPVGEQDQCDQDDVVPGQPPHLRWLIRRRGQ